MILSTASCTFPNRLLSSLPDDALGRLMAHAQEVQLELGTVLYESRQPIQNVFFPSSGLASVVTAMEDGTSIEVLVVSREGIVGLPALESPTHTVPTRAFMQIAGHGIKISASALREEFQRSGSLRTLLFRYFQFVFAQISQCAACNRLHDLEERLSRWLLMVHDRMDSDSFTLTHEFLAQMLGTRRSSVSLAAATLQRAGLIKYHRGQIQIIDREGLEDASCECYPIIKESWELFQRS